jgi:outer membrane lipoprotein-sorting protein
MSCDRVRRNIDAYVDGTLSPAQRMAFETHLAACADCQRVVEQADQLAALLRTELPNLAMAPAEQLALREQVLHQLGVRPAQPRTRWLRRIWTPRMAGVGLALALALLVALVLLPGQRRRVSAAEIVDRAQAAVDRHQGLSGVLYWEAEWSQRYPSGDQITRTFEIWFSFEDPGRYRLTQRNPDGRIYREMVRDGRDHIWQLSRSVLSDGRERIQVDEIILSPAEMQELSSWYVPSPFLDELDRFTDVLNSVEKVADIEVAGRPAYVLRDQLFGFGQPGDGNRIDPVTSTIQLVVDAETYWVLGRAEQVPGGEGEQPVAAGVIQRTRRFEMLAPEHVPPAVFEFTVPSGAEVHTVVGMGEYYASSPDAISLHEAAKLTSFSLVLPSRLPGDLQARPYFRYACQGAQCYSRGYGTAGTFGIIYLGEPGRQAFLQEHAQAAPLGRAARAVAVGNKQGWLVPDLIDGHKFSLYLVDPKPDPGPDGRPWPATVELQAWGLSLDEAVMMLASLKPYPRDAARD